MGMTIRKCIEQMRKVGGHVIYLNNETELFLIEMNVPKWDEIGTFKRDEQGKIKVMRRILCSIKSNDRTKMIEEIKKRGYWMYNPKSDWNFFHENDYLLPERVANEFINANKGIDTYQTISSPYYMMVDIMSMYDDFD